MPVGGGVMGKGMLIMRDCQRPGAAMGVGGRGGGGEDIQDGGGVGSGRRQWEGGDREGVNREGKTGRGRRGGGDREGRLGGAMGRGD